MDSKTYLRLGVLLVIVAGFLAIDTHLVTTLMRWQPAGIDFLAIWAGARMALEHPSSLYDFGAVTEMQRTFLGPAFKIRPFIYPPSATVVFLPFAVLDYWWAYGAFMLLSSALYLSAALRISDRILSLALLATAPCVVLAALAGQLCFLIGGLVLLAFTEIRRPILAGVLLGVAAAVKPQLLILFPLALALEQRWRVLASALAAGALLCLGSLALVGASGWIDWFAALPRFSRLITHDRGLLGMVITPTGFLTRSGLQGAALGLGQALFAFGGALVVWRTFTRPSPADQRLMALIGGGLLITPYAMNYELAIIAPAATVLAARLEDPYWPCGALALLLLSLKAPGLIALAGLLFLILYPWRPARPQAVSLSATS